MIKDIERVAKFRDSAKEAYLGGRMFQDKEQDDPILVKCVKIYR